MDGTADSEILAVEGLRVVRGGTVVLRNVSWSFSQGERWVIMGANGSGKTSLLSALTGLLVPTAGTMRLLGRTYGEDDWSGLKNVVSLVSSSVRQMVNDDELAVEVIASGLHGQINYWGRLTSEELGVAERMGRSVGCGNILRRSWAVLSQGERQRVLIARALVAEPQMLILDEPCAGLDPAAREHFLNFLNDLALKRKAPALVLVTHHVEEIMPNFTHVLGLKAGRVLAAGRKEEVLRTEVMSELFNASARVRAMDGRYALELGNAVGRRVM